MVDMDMVDMDIVDGHGGHGIGHSGLKKRSIAMVHYWVRHAKCTWSSLNVIVVNIDIVVTIDII